MSSKTKKQQIRRRIAKNRNAAIRQIKAVSSKERVLNQAIAQLSGRGYLDKADLVNTSKNVKSATFLNACGIDVSLAGLGKDYQRRDFSLLKEETGTEIIQELKNSREQYQDLRRFKKPLDVKKISLSDSLRVLDQQKTVAERKREKITNYSKNNDFTQLATVFAAANSKAFSGKLKYFAYYGSDTDPRYCITTNASTKNTVVNSKINDQGVN